MKRVVIVGMGFGGIRAASALAGKGLDVLVIDRRNFHLFQPLLYQVATAMLDQEAIAHSIRAIVRHWRGIHFRLGEVQGIDVEKKEIATDAGPVPYDYAVIAAGSVSNFFGMESVRAHAYDLKQLDDAVRLRNHILETFEKAAVEQDPARRAALMTFVIVGGGPTGVEFAGALSELTRHVLRKDYPELPMEQCRIVMVEAAGQLLGPFAASLQKYAQKRLGKMKVEVRLNTAIADATPEQVTFKDGSTLATHTLFWAAGVQAAPLAATLPAPKARDGRVKVEPDLSVPSHPDIFVIGDMAYLEQDGKPLPMVAPFAMQGGEYVAKAILQRDHDHPVKPFRYWDKGSMAVIGRNAAVAMTGPFKMSGFPAWLSWLGLHLFFLIGFRNRLLTLLNWAYDYVLFDRQVRLITRDAMPPKAKAAP